MSTTARATFLMRPLLELVRPPNLVTAAADAVAGYCIAGLPHGSSLPFLAASAVLLYGGGVVFNDVFDAALDAAERPERAIPSGRVSWQTASILGAVLLISGVGAASFVSITSGALALLIAGLAVFYDARGKRSAVGGPVNMGLCRAGSLLLGVSAAPHMLAHFAWLGVFPLLYIMAVTTVSRGEVHGGRRTAQTLALLLMGTVLAGLALLGTVRGFHFWQSLPFLLLLAWRVLPAYIRAWRTLLPADAGRAVRAGVLSLIVLDAALAAASAGIFYGLAVLSLLLVASGIAKMFAVT